MGWIFFPGYMLPGYRVSISGKLKIYGKLFFHKSTPAVYFLKGKNEWLRAFPDRGSG
jgi:hypothetical protein